MAKYKVTDGDVEASREYLEKIYTYSREHNYGERGIEPVLIGGWGVHAYNPWFGSLDIDLIANSKVTASLKHFLIQNEFGIEEIEIGNKVLSKPIQNGRKIIIDFISKEMGFEGHMEDLLKASQYIENKVHKNIDHLVDVIVPEITVLFVYKLKAAWDRNYRLENKSSNDIEWEEAKLAKDYGDIAALINADISLNPKAISRAFSDFKFLWEVVKRMKNDPSLYNSYSLRTNVGKNKIEKKISTMESLV